MKYLIQGHIFFKNQTFSIKIIQRVYTQFIGVLRLFGYVIIHVSILSKFLASAQNTIYSAVHNESQFLFLAELGKKWNEMNIQVWRLFEIQYVHPTLIIKNVFIDLIMIGTFIYFLYCEYLYLNKN